MMLVVIHETMDKVEYDRLHDLLNHDYPQQWGIEDEYLVRKLDGKHVPLEIAQMFMAVDEKHELILSYRMSTAAAKDFAAKRDPNFVGPAE